MTVEAGTVLGRYRLLERIGEGGMGEVWKAHDDNLDRDVAIKMLLHGTLGNATTRERFRREALVLSRLSHPGVATIFDFDIRDGCEFLVMEYVAGGTLESRLTAGPLPIDDVLRLGAGIAEALDNAHRHGFLHRDLKPGNVALTADGHPKILDFGIALLLADDKAAAGRITQTGTFVGSLPYMAPEQLLGEVCDARTDIYALGVLLFEMLTAQLPFVKERFEALMFAIISTAAQSVRSLRPDVPAALDRLVAECLRKDPAHRPPSAAHISEALRGIREGVPTAALPLPPRDVIRAIAVLPLRNVSRDPSREYFADGMTESLISDLAKVKALRVISRTSVMTYKGVEKSVPEIARELNVDAILEGSALLVANRVRLSVQLVSGRTDETLWAERYDRDLEDVLGMQSELAETVAREIAIQITPNEVTKLANRPAVNPEAHLEFLKSRHSFSGSPEALEVGLRHARRALELDPTSALAWTAVADCNMFRAIRGIAQPAEAIAAATFAANKALELDPSLADAYVSIGAILSHTGDLAGGLRALQKAVELNPGLAHAHSLLGRALYSYERHTEALAAMNKSLSLDPLSMMIFTGVGDAYYFAREYEKSVFHYRMSLELDPRFDGTHTGLARSLEALGRFDEARKEYEEGRRLSGGIAGPSFGLAHLEAASGNEKEARRILAELMEARSKRVVSAWGIAVLHASLGDIDEAFRWLAIAVEERASGLLLLRVHPRLDPIRKDPRYLALVKRLGLGD